MEYIACNCLSNAFVVALSTFQSFPQLCELLLLLLLSSFFSYKKYWERRNENLIDDGENYENFANEMFLYEMIDSAIY